MSGGDVNPHEPIIFFPLLTTRHVVSCDKNCDFFVTLAFLYKQTTYTDKCSCFNERLLHYLLTK